MLMRSIGMMTKSGHEFHFPEDIIRNDEDMEYQKRKKIYLHAFKDLLDEIHKVDPNYEPH